MVCNEIVGMLYNGTKLKEQESTNGLQTRDS